MPSHVLARMATTGIYLLHGIPRDVQHAARGRAVREETTLRTVLSRVWSRSSGRPVSSWPSTRSAARTPEEPALTDLPLAAS